MRRLLPLLLLAACGDPVLDARQALIEGFARDLTAEAYATFQAEAEAASQATAAYCQSPSPSGLTAAQTAWRTAKTRWKITEVVQFGPVVEYPERLGPLLDRWPMRPSDVDELLASDLAVDAEAVARMGAATRGLPVAEYLLFGKALEDDARACTYAQGLMTDIHENAEILVRTWNDPWVGWLTEPSETSEGPYASVQDVLDEWVNRMAFTVENIRVMKLGKPVGDDAGGVPPPELLESPHSDTSMDDALAALQGVQLLWEGTETTPGVRSLPSVQVGTRDRLDTLFATTYDRLRQVPQPLRDTLLTEPEVVAWAQEALLELQKGLQIELAQDLSVTITFNDNDGD